MAICCVLVTERFLTLGCKMTNGHITSEVSLQRWAVCLRNKQSIMTVLWIFLAAYCQYGAEIPQHYLKKLGYHTMPPPSTNLFYQSQRSR